MRYISGFESLLMASRKPGTKFLGWSACQSATPETCLVGAQAGAQLRKSVWSTTIERNSGFCWSAKALMRSKNPWWAGARASLFKVGEGVIINARAKKAHLFRSCMLLYWIVNSLSYFQPPCQTKLTENRDCLNSQRSSFSKQTWRKPNSSMINWAA